MRSLAACCALAKRAAHSASPALETMHGMMEENTCSSVDVERLFFIAEKEIASDDRSGVKPRKIGSIHVKKKMHVAGVVCDAIVAPGRSVTECTVSGGKDFLCRISLL